MRRANLAVVTGAGGGIGGAIARRLAREGHVVACVDRDSQSADATAAGLPQAAPFVCDVSNSSDVGRFRDEVVTWVGTPSVLVNAADIFELCRVPDISEECWDRVVDINLKGVFLVCRAFLPLMIEAHSGLIINMASMSGLVAARDRAAYAAAKAGVVLLSRSFAFDHGPEGVRVNCICPGLIDTPMASWVTSDEARLAAWLERVPARRIGTPDDIASAVAFVASPEADYIHGATLVVDGGGSAWAIGHNMTERTG